MQERTSQYNIEFAARNIATGGANGDTSRACESYGEMNMEPVAKPVRKFDPFRLVSEFIVLCLGALLLLLAISGRVPLPARPAGIIGVGVLFIYMAARAYSKPDAGVTRAQSNIRAVSLAIVGILLINIAVFHTGYTMLLLGIAGGVLVLRGLLSAVFSLTNKS